MAVALGVEVGLELALLLAVFLVLPTAAPMMISTTNRPTMDKIAVHTL